MSSPNPTRVSNLVAHHTAEIERVSPSTSPTQTRAQLPAADTAAEPKQPGSPTPKGKDLPVKGELTPAGDNATKADEGAAAAPGAAPAAASNGGDAANGALEDIAEGAETDSAAAAAAAASAGDKQGDGDEAAPSSAMGDNDGDDDDKEAPKVPYVAEEIEVPLGKLKEGIDAMGPTQQEIVRTNLERASDYPSELPLSASWTLFFSDTSGAAKSNSAAATKEAYHEGINPIFSAKTVPELCGQYKAFKQAPKSKRAKAGDPETLGLTRPGMNLHFFRAGINPTWEDPYNEKGGRITISPSAALFDNIYERLVFLLAGAALELGTSDLLSTEGPSPGSKRPPTPGPPQEGQINGVVASRRARGDRIEIWLGGREKKTPVPLEWLDRFREVLAVELEMPELKSSKYKKHF
ncbi:hypothetical protein JCM9279_001550 [Rhodotorula babjevae]